MAKKVKRTSHFPDQRFYNAIETVILSNFLGFFLKLKALNNFIQHIPNYRL